MVAVVKRVDVWSLDEWDPVLDWYEKAVEALQQLPIDNPCSWWSLAAVHGIHRAGWEAHGFLQSGQTLPNLNQTLWNQCQHQSWYFLPWHRGYLACFEQIVRDTVAKLGGPRDWALPYWNYNGQRPRSIELPLAFRQPMRDGGKKNHLFVQARFGTDGKGGIDIQPHRIPLKQALGEGDFSDITGGFGGPTTIFNEGGNHNNGQLEALPHNVIHGLVGGAQVPDPSSWTQVGLMSTPATAALDPIFWLHHANIDRLWEVWLGRDARNQNPTDPAWLNGPPQTGRAFMFSDPDGQIRQVQVADVSDTRKLGYEYDDVTDPLPGVPSRHAPAAGALLSTIADLIMSGSSRTPREFAANVGGRLQLASDDGETRVRIDPASKPQNAALQDASGILPPAPGPRVYLSLDGIQSTHDTPLMDVYVAAPAVPTTATAAPDIFVGTVSMFGASRFNDAGGTGFTQTLDITDSYQALQRSGALNQDELTVKFRKATDMSDLSSVSIGKIRLIHKP